MSDLVRLARAADGSLLVSRTAPGRGAWLCAVDATRFPSPACVEQAVRRKALAKALRTPVEQATIEALRESVEERARIDSGGTASVAARRRD
jgi:predicted RNA-binding protein YlxR (DUF448 family)